MATLITERIDELTRRVRRDVDEGILPSAQLAVGLGGDVVWAESFGSAADSNRYAIFSCTKALVAGVAWQLIDEGLLDVAQPVTTYFPEFGENGKHAVTVEHLLTHTGGFPSAPMSPDHWGSRESRKAKMASWRTNFEPGTYFEYHPTAGHWVLGEIIEGLDGGDIQTSIERRILGPLGLHELALGVAPDDQGDIVDLVVSGSFPTPDELEAVFGVREFDIGEVTPDLLLGFNTPEARNSRMPGGGGVSNASDLAALYQAFLHNPDHMWSADVLKDGTATIRVTLPDPVLGVPANRTLGLIAAGDDGLSMMRGMGHNVSAGAFGHNGAGGQIAFADPATGLSFAYLTNGIDANFLRQARRVVSVASRAGLLTTPVE